MSFTRAAFNPVNGLKDTSAYPTNPTDETAARKQVQDNLDQMKDAINVLEGELEAGAGAAKLGCTGAHANIQDFIDATEAAGSGSTPGADVITNAMMNSTVKLGLLANLLTTAKDSFVNAINEIFNKIGSLAGLATTDKSSVVAAINEVNTKTASALTTEGDMLYRNASEPTRLAKGTARQQLLMNSGATAPEWGASLQSLMTAAGDIVYASGANTPARLALGSSDKALISNGTNITYGYPVVPYYTAGCGEVLLSSNAEVSKTNSGWETFKTFTIKRGGKIILLFEAKSSGSGGFNCRVVADDVSGSVIAQSQQIVLSGTYESFAITTTVSALAGKSIYLQIENPGGAYTNYVRDLSVYGNTYVPYNG